MNYQIINGNNIDVLKTFPDNHFDSIVTDPPYGIDFLGKAWDANTGALETYQQCLRVLKPGGHILAFSAARTYHHLAITLEQAGFEIRDQIMWIYSSGFPKSQDVGKSIQRSLGVKETKTTKALNGYAKEQTAHGAQRVGDVTKDDYEKEITSTVCTDPLAQQWQGWGTALKPAHEPIALARKPFKGSIKDNVLKHGVGAINIDATRVPYESEEDIQTYLNNKAGPAERGTGKAGEKINMFEKSVGYKNIKKTITREEDLPEAGRFPSNVLGEIAEPYQKYFYCPKVSRRERHAGFEDLPKRLCGPGGDDFVQAQDHQRSNNPPTVAEMILEMGGHFLDHDGNKMYSNKDHGSNIWLPEIGMTKVHGLKMLYESWCKKNNKNPNIGNNHPTVKPIELMKYLIKLITPKGGIVLDPFNGSGSTGCAAVELGCEYVGIELDPKYVEIATKRIEAWNKETTTFKEIFE